ncbi:MAG: type II secretion system protein [Candidatus Paceibacterota bacterium]
MIKRNKKNGFLLIEMLVAVSIFTIVMLISITAVLSILDVNKKNQSMKSVINNLNLVINGMAKNMTVSKGYFCGIADSLYPNGNNPGDYIGENADCNQNAGQNTDPGKEITMLSNKDLDGDGNVNDVIRYRFVNDPETNIGRVERSINSTEDDSFVSITSPEVDIESLSFYVFDTEPLIVDKQTGFADGDTRQPRVVMVVRGYAGVKESTKTQFNIQTTITQRSLDIVYK